MVINIPGLTLIQLRKLVTDILEMDKMRARSTYIRDHPTTWLSNLQQRSTTNCAMCMDQTSWATVWSDDGAGNSLKAETMCITKTVVANHAWWHQNWITLKYGKLKQKKPGWNEDRFERIYVFHWSQLNNYLIQ